MSHLPEKISFQFQTLSLPPKYLQHYNEKQLELVVGRYPVKANEVLLPDFLASYYDKSETVTFNVRNEQAEFIDKNYQVVGSYKTNYQFRMEAGYEIYTCYRQDSESLAEVRNQKFYEEMKAVYSKNKETRDYSSEIVDTFEKYVQSIDTAKTSMLMIVDKPENVKKVS